MTIVSTIPDFPVFFLRRMVGWCCWQVGLPPACVREAKFCGRRTVWVLGRAFLSQSRIVVNINPTDPLAVRIAG